MIHMMFLEWHRIRCCPCFKTTAKMGYNVIGIHEKYNAVILGVKVAKGKDNQPKSCYFVY